MSLIIALNLFFATIFLVTRETKLRFRNKEIVLDYARVSILVLILLIISGIASISTVKNALMPQFNIVPWQILIIFFGSAYVCTSLDMSGVLKYFAYKLVLASKENGVRLYFNLVFLTAIMTIFTSNDIVTLTLTPIVAYIARYSGINPIPFLISIFFASNTWSMIFYIGNPTNVIVAQAYSLRFFEYAKYMLLPTLVAGIVSTLMFFLIYRKQIPQAVSLAQLEDPKEDIVNKYYSILNVVVFAIFFGFLAFGDLFNLELWKTILVFCGIYAVLNLIFSSSFASDSKDKFTANFSFFFETFKRVPWKILPLVLVFFVFVYIFNLYGLTRYVGNLINFKNQALGTVLMALITSFAANLMINQPMTILFANAMKVAGIENLKYAYALVIGSNLGGNITLMGALAGLMWSRILAYYGIKMDNKTFVKNTLPVVLVTIVASSLALLF
ncbi:ArsB/NhaD family transporter [Pseudothermotoga thermarum]|uniref:Arsenite efflux membrane protein ArsB n=1 Tax=Pseudothermotoga thermarum DSM 5069 TaxID=688269 RepID=F7YWZ4_9THEM|nr:SLC13 family permease [Pseudothermotoga thermarum]AEH50586.1 arsenite efflux membrane protein ArsB [Pseudothermotoga thermarum DSM 5069]